MHKTTESANTALGSRAANNRREEFISVWRWKSILVTYGPFHILIANTLIGACPKKLFAATAFEKRLGLTRWLSAELEHSPKITGDHFQDADSFPRSPRPRLFFSRFAWFRLRSAGISQEFAIPPGLYFT